jgi:glycosyltransferase involved in cell wall biosynthesis
MPRSILEAMAMARPVLTTDVPGCRETVVSGVNGFLVPARDASALADAMVELVDRADELAEMGRASRKIAEERFDVRIVNRTILGAIGLPSVNVQKTSVA